MEAEQELSILEVSKKCQSKKELYTILMITGDLFLHPILFANQKYLRDIWTERKRYVKCSQVVVTKVLHLEELVVSRILKFAMEHFDILKFLPEYNFEKATKRK